MLDQDIEGTNTKPFASRSRSASSTSRDGADHAVTPRVRIAVVAGGRSSEHAISLASARSVIEALDPGALRRRHAADRRAGGWQVVDGAAALLGRRRGRAARASSRPAAARRSCPGGGGGALVGAQRRGAGRDRRRVPRPARAVRRGRHDPGPARDARAALRRRRRARLGGEHGQGVLQGGAARRGHRRRALARAAARRRRSARSRRSRARRRGARLAGLREAGQPRLERRHQQGARARGAAPTRSSSPTGTTRRCSSRSSSPGREIECGVLGNERPVASAVGEILPHAEWYDYAAKYDEGGSDIVVPADLPAAVAERVRAIALDAFRALELSGMARVDCFLSPGGRGARERGQHDSRVHVDLGLRAALRGRRRELSRGARPARRSARSSATRAARATATDGYGPAAVWSSASAMLAAKPVSTGASLVIQIR